MCTELSESHFYALASFHPPPTVSFPELEEEEEEVAAPIRRDDELWVRASFFPGVFRRQRASKKMPAILLHSTILRANGAGMGEDEQRCFFPG